MENRCADTCTGCVVTLTPAIAVGDLVLDLRRFELLRNGKVIPTTVQELRLMELFMLHQNTILPYVAIGRMIWPGDPKVENTIPTRHRVRTIISRLRKKIGPIENPSLVGRDGIGYGMFSEDRVGIAA